MAKVLGKEKANSIVAQTKRKEEKSDESNEESSEKEDEAARLLKEGRAQTKAQNYELGGTRFGCPKCFDTNAPDTNGFYLACPSKFQKDVKIMRKVMKNRNVRVDGTSLPLRCPSR